MSLKPEWAVGVIAAVIGAHWIWWIGRRLAREFELHLAIERSELWIVILLIVATLIVSARAIGVTCQTVDVALTQICSLAIALFGLLVAGIVDFYQRATIAMYTHIECPSSVRNDLTEIRDALRESAKRLQS